jgi:hypothetical protein
MFNKTFAVISYNAPLNRLLHLNLDYQIIKLEPGLMETHTVNGDPVFEQTQFPLYFRALCIVFSEPN